VALKYEVVTSTRSGKERRHQYATDSALGPGAVIVLDGRHWLIERVEEEGSPPRAFAKPARYRLRLRHPAGREELGAFRRYRPDGPRLGHAFTTLEDGLPVNWEVVDEQLALDEQGEPYLALVAERDYSELEEIPDHELEHALARGEWSLPEAAAAMFSRAEQAGLLIELVALEAGEEPDWEEAARYLDALVIEEVEDDLIEQCGVNPDRDPRETWLDTVKERLRADREAFRADIEGDHDQIEEWDFRGGRIFASVGTFEDEADPNSGHGWMCRLVDSEALGAAGLDRVQRVQLDPEVTGYPGLGLAFGQAPRPDHLLRCQDLLLEVAQIPRVGRLGQ